MQIYANNITFSGNKETKSLRNYLKNNASWIEDLCFCIGESFGLPPCFPLDIHQTNEVNKMEIQEEQIQTNTQNNNWIEREKEELENNTYTKLPTMKFAEDTPTKISIDIQKPWERYEEINSEKNITIVKKIIPVMHNGELKNWWLNTKNPIYKDIVEKAAQSMKEGKISFEVSIFRTGQMKNTRYRIIK